MMSLPPQNTAVLCSVRPTWLLTVGLWGVWAGPGERRQGWGSAGKAGGMRAGPGNCLDTALWARTQGGVRVPARLRWEERGRRAGSLQLLNEISSSTNLKERGKGKPPRCQPSKQTFCAVVVCEGRGRFGSWSSLAMPPTWEHLRLRILRAGSVPQYNGVAARCRGWFFCNANTGYTTATKFLPRLWGLQPPERGSCQYLPRAGGLQDTEPHIASSHLSSPCWGSRRAELQLRTPTLTPAMTSEQLTAVKRGLLTTPARWEHHRPIAASDRLFSSKLRI